jgi:hypothetical protein
MSYKEKTCSIPNCSNRFIPTSGTQKYCPSCREKATKLKDKERWKKTSRKRNGYKLHKKKCKVCGKEFETHYKRQVTCGSEECDKERRRINSAKTHKKRSKKYLIEKGRRYYKENNKKCKLKKARDYRKKNSNAKKYDPGKTHQHTTDYVRKYVSKFGYKLLTKKYINNRQKLLLLCPKGHEWSTNFHNFKDMGNRCFRCYVKNDYVSKFEVSVRNLVKKMYKGSIILNDRNTVFNNKTKRYLELDIYLPKEKIAIECNGIYWHSKSKVKENDKIKRVFCKRKGIKLIIVTDDEWFNGNGKDKISSLLSNL